MFVCCLCELTSTDLYTLYAEGFLQHLSIIVSVFLILEKRKHRPLFGVMIFDTFTFFLTFKLQSYKLLFYYTILFIFIYIILI